MGSFLINDKIYKDKEDAESLESGECGIYEQKAS